LRAEPDDGERIGTGIGDAKNLEDNVVVYRAGIDIYKYAYLLSNVSLTVDDEDSTASTQHLSVHMLKE
jgi:hypothetical protein